MKNKEWIFTAKDIKYMDFKDLELKLMKRIGIYNYSDIIKLLNEKNGARYIYPNNKKSPRIN